MDYGKGSAAGSGGSSVLKIVNDLAKGSKMPTVSITREKISPRLTSRCKICTGQKFLDLLIVMFQELINNHITRLQSSVGLTCGTVQEVSNKHLQVRI